MLLWGEPLISRPFAIDICLPFDHFDSQYTVLFTKYGKSQGGTYLCKALDIIHQTLALKTTLISHPRTHFSIVVLRLCVEQTADPLHTAELDLHISQIAHHPVQIVRHLEYEIQNCFRNCRNLCDLCEYCLIHMKFYHESICEAQTH